MDLALVNKADSLRLAKALVETLHNAIFHGNLELTRGSNRDRRPAFAARRRRGRRRREQSPYCDRRVQLRAVFSPREARFVVQDEGPGFDTTRLPNVKTDPSYLSRGGGRGLVLIHMFMDEVTFNSTGNEITLVKRACSEV